MTFTFLKIKLDQSSWTYYVVLYWKIWYSTEYYLGSGQLLLYGSDWIISHSVYMQTISC